MFGFSLMEIVIVISLACNVSCLWNHVKKVLFVSKIKVSFEDVIEELEKSMKTDEDMLRIIRKDGKDKFIEMSIQEINKQFESVGIEKFEVKDD